LTVKLSSKVQLFIPTVKDYPPTLSLDLIARLQEDLGT